MIHHGNTKLCQPSLVHLFDAPDDYVGEFGWLCGFSADAIFLNDAAERFTRLTLAQRSQLGRIVLAVFLDPGNPAITILDAPGVAHLPILDIKSKPFRLLHAKIGLLGFKHIKYRNKWCVRLIVTTGNWTRQTLEDSLDLAWCINISSESCNDERIIQDLVDIKAAHELLKWIEKLFDTRLLDAEPSGQFNETKDAMDRVELWLKKCYKKASGQPRFFDNRYRSFLTQIPDMVKTFSSSITRNYLGMGSGYYESVSDKTQPPKVPKLIIERLRRSSLLTGSSNVDLYVNPRACQSIATSISELNKQGITIRPATTPPSVFGEEICRSLHAKFIFCANRRSNSDICNSSWVYLGSGNLTTAGFTEKMNPYGGNLEVGVVFSPGILFWEGGRGIIAEQVVTNLLPIQFTMNVDGELNQLAPGLDMESRDASYIAPPIAWFTWWEEAGQCELRTTEYIPDNFILTDPAGGECHRNVTGFIWRGDQPRQVRCRWISDGEQNIADVPVIDHYGRIAATKLIPISIEEAWGQLADFPMPPEDEVEDESMIGDNEGTFNEVVMNDSRKVLDYPVRQMMELVESIAVKQIEVDKSDWKLWCSRLEQILGQAKDCSIVKIFREIGLNPLSPLYHSPFRPNFTVENNPDLDQLYENTLKRIEKSWAVDHLDSIGSQQ